jgi:hypothetical protein
MNQGSQLPTVGPRDVNILTKGIHQDTNGLVPLPRIDHGVGFLHMQPEPARLDDLREMGCESLKGPLT